MTSEAPVVSTDGGSAALAAARRDVAESPALRMVDVVKDYRLRRRSLAARREVLQAVAGVSLDVGRGETVGLVGESGSGKSTMARLAMRLVDLTSGTVELDGIDVTNVRGRELRSMRRQAQMVFQDPYASFDPLSPILESVGEPLHTHFRLGAKQRRTRVGELLDQVGMRPELMDRYPMELSGGQLQRAAVARALAVEPKLIVLDEPVSALDVSTQAKVINLLQSLQADLGVAYLFIAHDLSVVHHISDRVAVMYLGRIVESGPATAVYSAPAHPYTAALLSAVPTPDPARERRQHRRLLPGDIPSPTDPPSGCRFRTRCAFAMDVCAAEDPPAFPTPAGSVVHCHLHTTGPRLDGRSVLSLDPVGPPTQT